MKVVARLLFMLSVGVVSVPALRADAYDTGRDGDANPAMVIADVGQGQTDSQPHMVPATTKPAVYKESPRQYIRRLENSKPDFIVTFTEDKKGFYINGQKF